MFTAARRILQEAVAQRVFPAAVVEVGDAARVRWAEAFGTLTYAPGSPPASGDTVFDLASLTKVISTTSLVMSLVERGGLRLGDRVEAWIPGWRGSDRVHVVLEDLLAHASGLPDTRPLFETMTGRASIERAICEMPLEYAPCTASRYSDLGFILLGFVLENAEGRGLARQFDELVRRHKPGWAIRYGIAEGWRPRTAPTQVDPWRGRLLQGEVDDRNAAALDGVAGHSGLFGTAEAVGQFARAVLGVIHGAARLPRLATSETLARFVRRVHTPGSSRALGWDTMLPSSSCGTRMSPAAFGHTGFTGTSLWIDPRAGISVVLLSNRVHPVAGNPSAIREVRRAVHDAVMGEIEDSGLPAAPDV